MLFVVWPAFNVMRHRRRREISLSAEIYSAVLLVSMACEAHIRRPVYDSNVDSSNVKYQETTARKKYARNIMKSIRIAVCPWPVKYNNEARGGVKAYLCNDGRRAMYAN